MIKNCPNCGVELKEKHKFCPECGYKLSEVYNNVETEVEKEVKICDHCGAENSPTAKTCEECGIKLTGEIKTVKSIVVNKPTPKPSLKPKTTNTQQKSNKSNVKNVKPAKKSANDLSIPLIPGVIGLVVIVLVILFAAGVFDSKEEQVAQNPGGGMNNQGATLEHIQEINNLTEVVKANPNNTEALLNLAHMQMDSRMWEAAAVNYEKYLKTDPANVNVIVDQGVCFHYSGNTEKAIANLTRALEINPRHQQALFNLGVMNLDINKPAEAKGWFQKAIAVDPNSSTGKQAGNLLNNIN